MDGPFIVSMLIFIITIFLVFKQPTVRIPFTSKYLRIDYGLAPIIGAIFLFAILPTRIDIITRGIIGTANLKPYAILILIISLSYIYISLDYTGLFEYLSLHVTRASRNSGKRLFVYFFLLSSFLTLFIGNDIVILTMTFIIFYISKNAGLDPIPFLFAQFFAVNAAGMALYIGNPTNIVIADAYGLSFMEFAKWMFLPAFFAEISCLFLLWLVFRRRIPNRFEASEIDPRSSLRNKKGALFGSTVLTLTIVFMSLPTSWIGAALWEIALFFAIVMFLYDVASYRSKISAITSRVPWKIIPFLIGLFTIVGSLASTGWTDLFAAQLSKISGNAITTIFGICFLSSLAAGAMNTHSMSIFFVMTFQESSFAALSQTTRLGSTLALIAGSNFGANLTLIGALAGIMWAKILNDKGCTITFSQFTKYGLLIMPLVIAMACLTLLAELMIFV